MSHIDVPGLFSSVERDVSGDDPATVVDGLFAISRALHGVASAITYHADLAEKVNASDPFGSADIASALQGIAEQIQDFTWKTTD